MFDGPVARANQPSYFYSFFESPRGFNFTGYYGGTSNGIDFGQRSAFPSSAFHGETNGSNAVIQTERVGSNGIPETLVAQRLAGVVSPVNYLRAAAKSRKAGYIANFFR